MIKRREIFVNNNFSVDLVDAKGILMHCVEFPPKQLVPHKYLIGEISKATKETQQNDKKLEQKAIRDLQQICPKQDHDFPSCCCVIDNLAQTIVSFSVFEFRSSITQKGTSGIKIESIWKDSIT